MRRRTGASKLDAAVLRPTNLHMLFSSWLLLFPLLFPSLPFSSFSLLFFLLLSPLPFASLPSAGCLCPCLCACLLACCCWWGAVLRHRPRSLSIGCHSRSAPALLVCCCCCWGRCSPWAFVVSSCVFVFLVVIFLLCLLAGCFVFWFVWGALELGAGARDGVLELPLGSGLRASCGKEGRGG